MVYGGHKIRRSFAAFLASLALIAAAFAAQRSDSSPTPSPMFAQVIAHLKEMELKLDVYERMQKVEYRKLGGDPTPYQVKVSRVFPSGTGVTRIPLSADGTPISESSYREDLEKLLAYLQWVSQPGSSQTEAFAKAEHKRKERHELMEMTQSAFVFTPDGEEMRGNRLLKKYLMKPNPDFKPTTRNGTIFKKVEGIVWIDQQSQELARIEGTVTDDITIAMFLAKVNKGSHFMQERYEVQPGFWAPTFEQYDFDGRKFLVSFNIHERTFFSNYRHVGPPAEAIAIVRDELSKTAPQASSGQ